MKYEDAAAFRMALEQRLKDGAGDGAELSRNRKRVAFDRLLVRLQAVAADRWVLKGGFALDRDARGPTRRRPPLQSLGLARGQTLRDLPPGCRPGGRRYGRCRDPSDG